jgi:hypothetical protein
MSNCRIDERLVENNFEGSGFGLIEMLSKHLTGVAEESHETPHIDR